MLSWTCSSIFDRKWKPLRLCSLWFLPRLPNLGHLIMIRKYRSSGALYSVFPDRLVIEDHGPRPLFSALKLIRSPLFRVPSTRCLLSPLPESLWSALFVSYVAICFEPCALPVISLGLVALMSGMVLITIIKSLYVKRFGSLL